MARRKGAGFEREVVNALKALGYAAQRAWHMAQFKGHDVVISGFATECKRYAKIAVYAWWEQACAQAKRHGGTPLVVMRADRKPDTLVVMRLEDWAAMAAKAGVLDACGDGGTIPPSSNG